MDWFYLTIQTLASTIRRSPRLVRASATVRIDLPSNAIPACCTDAAGVAACATCAVGACEACVTDLIPVRDAAVGEIACSLICCHVLLKCGKALQGCWMRLLFAEKRRGEGILKGVSWGSRRALGHFAAEIGNLRTSKSFPLRDSTT